jgi:hypothetical protein
VGLAVALCAEVVAWAARVAVTAAWICENMDSDDGGVALAAQALKMIISIALMAIR